MAFHYYSLASELLPFLSGLSRGAEPMLQQGCQAPVKPGEADLYHPIRKLPLGCAARLHPTAGGHYVRGACGTRLHASNRATKFVSLR